MSRHWLVLLIATVVGVVAIYVTWFIYIDIGGFDGNFSNKNGDWGAFGSYFGGVLSPVFALLGMLAVVATFILQKIHLDIQMEQNLKQDLIKVIDSTESEIQRLLSYEYSTGKDVIIFRDVLDNAKGLAFPEILKASLVQELLKLCCDYVDSLMIYQDDIGVDKIFKFYFKRLTTFQSMVNKNSAVLEDWDRTINVGMMNDLIKKIE